jgi:aspartate carbamoyltransferase catalytic subunit
MYQVISGDQFSKKKLIEIFAKTNRIKANPEKYRSVLKHKIVALMFYEPSTRTRFSFAAAVKRLGGMVISAENAAENSSGAKGETIEDTVMTLQGYVDAIVMRHPSDDAAERAGKVARVPFFNAGSGKKEHPTQALLDVYTIFQTRGNLDNLKIAVVGDLKYGRTVHSLLKLLILFRGLEVHTLAAEALALPSEYVKLVEKRGGKVVAHKRWGELPSDLDVIYQTRIQMERLQNEKLEPKDAIFVIDKKVMTRFGLKTILLHPLPRAGEVSPEVDNDKRALYFKQAQNGLYVRMALLLEALWESDIEENVKNEQLADARILVEGPPRFFS